MAAELLIKAGALRQFSHNDGSEDFVFGYDKEVTDRELAKRLPEWIKCEDRMPADETPVLIAHSGDVKIGELRWDHPGFEDTYESFQYWDDPNDDGQCWDWEEVTHWMHIPALPLPE